MILGYPGLVIRINAAISVLAFGLQRLASVGLVVGGSHILGSLEFGKFALIYALCVNVGSVAIDSLSATAGVYVTRKSVESEEAAAVMIRAIFRAAVFVAIVLSAAVFVGADGLSRIAGQGGGLSDLYRIAALLLLFQIPAAVLNATLYTIDRGRHAAVCTGTLSILTVVLGLLAAKSLGATGMSLALAFTSMLGCSTYLILLPSKIRSTIWKGRGFRQIYSDLPVPDFIFPTAASMLLTTPIHLVCLNMLAASSNGLHETAVFSAFYVICSLFLFVPAALSNFIVPHLTRVIYKTRQRFAFTAAITLGLIAAVSFVLLAFVFLTWHWIILLFGIDFRASGETLLLLAAVGFTSSLLVGANQLMWVTGKTAQNFGFTLSCAVCYLSATLYFVLHAGWGSAGLATSLLVAQCLQLCMYAVVYVRKMFSGGGLVGERSA
jgi:EPS I polysaccharide export inner membrane protein EpsE